MHLEDYQIRSKLIKLPYFIHKNQKIESTLRTFPFLPSFRVQPSFFASFFLNFLIFSGIFHKIKNIFKICILYIYYTYICI
jgi:hypothetical protein